MGYRTIAQWLNKNTHKTMTGHEVKNTYIFSILKKKKLREGRLIIKLILNEKHGYSYP
jgi:hypothetical protein